MRPNSRLTYGWNLLLIRCWTDRSSLKFALSGGARAGIARPEARRPGPAKHGKMQLRCHRQSSSGDDAMAMVLAMSLFEGAYDGADAAMAIWPLLRLRTNSIVMIKKNIGCAYNHLEFYRTRAIPNVSVS